MSRLNREAARLARTHGAHAMTDITGFGLVGHAQEMLRGRALDFHIDFESLGLLPGAREYAEAGCAPGGTSRNRDYFERWTMAGPGLGAVEEALLYDPQTSGGLLMAVAQEDAPALLNALLDAGGARLRDWRSRPGDGHGVRRQRHRESQFVVSVAVAHP